MYKRGESKCDMMDQLEKLRQKSPKELHELIYKISLELPEEYLEECKDEQNTSN